MLFSSVASGSSVAPTGTWLESHHRTRHPALLAASQLPGTFVNTMPRPLGAGCSVMYRISSLGPPPTGTRHRFSGTPLTSASSAPPCPMMTATIVSPFLAFPEWFWPEPDPYLGKRLLISVDVVDDKLMLFLLSPLYGTIPLHVDVRFMCRLFFIMLLILSDVLSVCDLFICLALPCLFSHACRVLR